MSDFFLKAFFILGGLFVFFLIIAFIVGGIRKAKIRSGEIFNFSYRDVKLPNETAKEVFQKLRTFTMIITLLSERNFIKHLVFQKQLLNQMKRLNT